MELKELKDILEEVTGEPVAIGAFTESNVPSLPFIIILANRNAIGSDENPSDFIEKTFTIERYSENEEESPELLKWLLQNKISFSYSDQFISGDEMFEQSYEWTTYEN